MEEFTGYWWSPKRPKRRVAGTLRIADDGSASLALLDRVVTPSKSAPMLPIDEEHDRLFGEVVGADEKTVLVTLIDCQFAGSRVGGLPALTLRPTVVMIGAAHARRDRFVGAVVEFSGLADWAGRARPEYEFDETPFPREITVKYAAGDDVSFEVDFGKITLRHGPVFALGERAQLEDHLTFQIEPREPCSWSDLLGGPIRTLQNFLSFALDSTTAVTTLLVDIRAGRTKQTTRLRAIFQQRGELPDPGFEYRDDRMLFRRRDIGNARLPDLLTRWFELTAELPGVIDLHLAALYRPRVFGESRYLFASQSLEVLHRRSSKFVSESMPKAAFKAWRDGILQQLDPADRPRVKRSLGTNRKGFKLVLEEVFASSKRLMADLGVSHNQLKKRSADLRNEVVHGLDLSENSAAMYVLAATLRLVMGSYLMQAIGFTEDETRALLAGDGRFRGGRQVTAWWSDGF